MNRRSIIVVLIGAISALCGLGVATLAEQRWVGAVAGLVVAVVVGFVLLRVLTFAMGRMPRRHS